MNILYITSPFYLDSDLPLLKAYTDLGHSVYLVITIQPNSLNSTVVSISKQSPNEGLFDYENIYYDEFDLFKRYTGVQKIFILNILTNSLSFASIKFAFDISRLIKKFSIDIEHHIGIPDLTAIPALFFRTCKRIVTVHDPIPHENEESFKMKLMRIFSLSIFKNVILLNKLQANEFKKHYYASKKNIFYSRLGYYDTLRLFGDRKESSERTVLFYGRISKYKGVELLLQAFTIIQPKYHNIKLIIAGKGKFNFDITPYLDNPQIEILNDYVSLNDLCTLIKSCEFSVCPYISATQSGVVASVLALGKPVIVTNVGSLASMVDDGKSGFVVEPNNIEELANAMDKMLSDHFLLDSMYEYIRVSSEKGSGSWKEIAENNISIYNSSC